MTTESTEETGMHRIKREYFINQYLKTGGTDITLRWKFRLHDSGTMVATCTAVAHPRSSHVVESEGYESDVPMDLVPEQVLDKLRESMEQDAQTVLNEQHERGDD